MALGQTANMLLKSNKSNNQSLGVSASIPLRRLSSQPGSLESGEGSGSGSSFADRLQSCVNPFEHIANFSEGKFAVKQFDFDLVS